MFGHGFSLLDDWASTTRRGRVDLCGPCARAVDRRTAREADLLGKARLVVVGLIVAVLAVLVLAVVVGVLLG